MRFTKSLLLGGLILFAWALPAGAAPPRIQNLSKSQSNVDRVLMNSGMVTVMEFPKEIVEVRVGNPSEFKVQISAVSPKEVTISRLGRTTRPSNLIVRTARQVWVFDLVPSQASHQDFIRVRSDGSGEQGKVLERVRIGGEK